MVVLKPGEEAIDEGIIRFCKEKIAGYKKPRRIEFIDILPRSSAGKIQKVKLRDKFTKG